MLPECLDNYLWKKYLSDIDKMTLDGLLEEQKRMNELFNSNAKCNVEFLDNMVITGVRQRISRRIEDRKRSVKMGM